MRRFTISSSPSTITARLMTRAGLVLLALLAFAASVGTPVAFAQEATCSTGTAVPDVANNPGLVADCEALLASKSVLDPGGTRLNWSATVSMSSWQGVTLSGTPLRVTELSLAGNPADPDRQLTGSIPAKLGDLDSLTFLYLYGNRLTGSIPAELGNIGSLLNLFLYDNRLTGSIPAELGDISGLLNLLLHDNQLTGNVPADLGDLSSLRVLNLKCNELMGSVPSELSGLSGLRANSLSLYGNQLTGSVPSGLADKLEPPGLSRSGCARPPRFEDGTPTTLTIEAGAQSGANVGDPVTAYDPDGDTLAYRLSGDDAASFAIAADGQMKVAAQTLEVGDYEVTIEASDGTGRTASTAVTISATAPPSPCLTGAAVPDAANNPGLVKDCEALLASKDTLDPSGTKLNWSASLSISSWWGVTLEGTPSRVTKLNPDSYQLTGSIPTELEDLSNLTYLSLWGNQLTGSIPTELGNLSNLKQLHLHINKLTGSIPTELSNLSNLTELVLHSNQLTGSIPTELSNLSNLEFLTLGDKLTGNIPAELGNLTNLTELHLHSNELTGSIPTELSNLSNLKGLGLARNQLTGSIPTELGNLSNLESLRLSGNQLTGSIPTELGNLSNLQILIFSDNQLTGSIPTELGNLTNLWALSFSDNQLTDSIPTELGNLANLQHLWISDNQLTGSIPTELGNLTNLLELHLANNQLTGSIPTELGNLSNLGTLHLEGNQLTGAIPAELGNLRNVISIYLQCNELTGSVPTELGSLNNIEVNYLILYGNQLTGSVPSGLTDKLRSPGLSRSGCARPPRFPEGTPMKIVLTSSAQAGVNVGDPVTAYDPDGDTLTYTLSGPDAASFAVAANGQLSIGASALSGGDYAVTVTAGDGTFFDNEEDERVERTASIDVTITVAAPPEQLGTPDVSAASTTSLNVSWTAPDSGSAITDYDLRYRVSGSDGEFTDFEHEGTTTSATIAGLAQNTEYEVQVRAVNASGTGEWSLSGIGSTNAPNHAPSFPPDIVSSDGYARRSMIESVGATVSVAADLGAPIAATDQDGDALTYSLVLDEGDAGLFTIDPSSGQIRTTASIYDYEARSGYLVQVEVSDGKDAEGISDDSPDASVDVLIEILDVSEPPVGRLSLTTGLVGANRLSISWNEPDMAGRPPVTGYEAQYRTAGRHFADATPTVNGRSVDIRGLSPYTLYKIRARALNEDGAGEWALRSIQTVRSNAPPSLPTGLITRDIDENAAPGAAVGAPIAATDDDKDALAYSLQETGDEEVDGAFTIDGSGLLRVSGSLDYESRVAYLLVVQVSDGKNDDGNPDASVDDTVTVLVRLGDVFELPPAPAAPTVTPASATALTVEWTVPGAAGSPEIDRYILLYKAASAASYEDVDISGAESSATLLGLRPDTLYDVQVHAYIDEVGLGPPSPAGQGRTNALNSAPSFPSAVAVRRIDESIGAAVSTVEKVGAPVEAQDGDGDALTYGLQGAGSGHAAFFTIDPATGQLSTVRRNYDYETVRAYLLVVQVSDGKDAWGMSSDAVDARATVIIQVRDLDE